MAKLLVQVCGDPTVDWLTIQGEDHYSRGESHPRLPDRPAAVARLMSRAGGSALILQFLKEMIPPELAEVEGRPAGLPDLLVIADSGLGFRSVTEGWPEVLGERRVPRPPVLRIPGVSAGFQPRRQPRADIQAGLSPDAEEAVPGPRPKRAPAGRGAAESRSRSSSSSPGLAATGSTPCWPGFMPSTWRPGPPS